MLCLERGTKCTKSRKDVVFSVNVIEGSYFPVVFRKNTCEQIYAELIFVIREQPLYKKGGLK